MRSEKLLLKFLSTVCIFDNSFIESWLKFLWSVGSNADKCPPGSYCPEKTSEPFPCPEGTYNPQYVKTSVSDCLNCTAGYYCNKTGQPKEQLHDVFLNS